jgi:hypothetical protein
MDSAMFFATAVAVFMTAFLISSLFFYRRVSESGWEVNIQGSANYAFLFCSYLIASIPAILSAILVFTTGYLYNSPQSLEFMAYASLNIGILALIYIYLFRKNNGNLSLKKEIMEST